MQANPPSEVRSAGAVSLRILIAFLVLFGAGLYEVVGLPHAPDSSIQVPDSEFARSYPSKLATTT